MFELNCSNKVENNWRKTIWHMIKYIMMYVVRIRNILYILVMISLFTFHSKCANMFVHVCLPGKKQVAGRWWLCITLYLFQFFTFPSSLLIQKCYFHHLNHNEQIKENVVCFWCYYWLLLIYSNFLSPVQNLTYLYLLFYAFVKILLHIICPVKLLLVRSRSKPIIHALWLADYYEHTTTPTFQVAYIELPADAGLNFRGPGALPAGGPLDFLENCS